MKFQREVTAAVLIPAVLAVLVFAPTWAFSLLVAAAACVALLEFYALLAAGGWYVPRSAGLVLFGALPRPHTLPLPSPSSRSRRQRCFSCRRS